MDNHGDTNSPLNLAAAVADIDSFIDPTLTASSEFFPHPHEHGHEHEHEDTIDVDGEQGPSQDVIDAVIKASLDQAQAEAEAEAQAQAQAQALALADAEAKAEEGVDLGINEQGDGTGEGIEIPSTIAEPRRGRIKIKPFNPEDPPGSEFNPFKNPVIHLAPFSKHNREDVNAPFPEHYEFENRGLFNVWLAGELSWCHYVQRRSTTPDKRSAERLQARIRAHERALGAMTPEEREAAAPLKTRRRNRVSPVLEKVTYTCHHSGSYTSQHSSTLPKEKLRLNTKRSVKCACSSRIVLNEIESGQCNVVFHWKHDGHDPYADADMEGGRLPRVIDTWLVGQIEAGKDLDDIRRALAMPAEEREDYMSKVQTDPATLDPNLPPPLALASKVKYPDIYNRYRKLKGPVKQNKPPAAAGSKRTSSGTVKRRKVKNAVITDTGVVGESTNDSSINNTPINDDGVGGENINIDIDIDPLLNLPINNHQEQNGEHEGGKVDVNDDTMAIPQIEDLSNLAASHEGLARALLSLPSGGGLRDEDGLEISLEEAMQRMANSVGVGHGGMVQDGEGEDVMLGL